MEEVCGCKKKHREEKEIKSLKNRLHRIEGQIRGIEKMVDEDVYCTDVLTQVAAAQSALNAFSRELLDTHIRTCVVREIKEGDPEVVDDLVKTIHRFMKN